MAAAVLYTCRGAVRGGCGVHHRTVRAAVRCCMRDQRGCEKVGGYSDRYPRRVDGSPLTDSEHQEIDWRVG